MGVAFYEAVRLALPLTRSTVRVGELILYWTRSMCPKSFASVRYRNSAESWQRLAMLARIWVTEPDVLLLDEPTNHLDLSKINQLERWINRSAARCAACHLQP